MPFADKFRATMDFPVVGDNIGGFLVESVDVGHVGAGGGRYEYPVRIVVKGKGGKQGVKTAFKEIFAAVKTTFSGYGNPYQCWILKMEIEGLGDCRYCIQALGAGARIFLEKELEKFFQHVTDFPPRRSSNNSTVVAEYMKVYQAEVEKQVRKNRYRIKKAEG